MQTRKIIGMAITALILVASQSLEAAIAFNTSQRITVVDSFREAHPLLMVFFNIGGILLLIGVCASVCAVLVKDPWER